MIAILQSSVIDSRSFFDPKWTPFDFSPLIFMICTPMTMTATATPVFAERHLRAIQRILDQMERTAQRTGPQYARVRKHERKTYRGPLTVFLPYGNREEPPQTTEVGCYPAWSYSLSQGGVGLIMPEEILQNDVWVGVHLPNNSVRWMFGHIVRRRPIPEEEFFDYGISFTQKQSEPTTAKE
jgi:hypothetical protein